MKQLSIPELHDTATILYTLAAPDTLTILQFIMDCNISKKIPIDALTEKDIAELTPFDIFTVKWNVNKLASVGIITVEDVATFSDPEARLVAINPNMPPVAAHIIDAIWPDEPRTGDVLLTSFNSVDGITYIE